MVVEMIALVYKKYLPPRFHGIIATREGERMIRMVEQSNKHGDFESFQWSHRTSQYGGR